MRVLHVIPTIGPRYGGPSAACAELCGALAMLGIDVSIYTTDIDRPVEWGTGEDGIVHRNGVAIHFFRAYGPKYYWLSFALFRALKDNVSKFDIVHIHSLYRAHLPIAVHYCLKYGIPYVIKPHGSLDPYLFDRRRWRKIIHEFLFERPALRKAAALQFTAEEEESLAATTSVFDHGTDYRNVIVPNGVVIPEGIQFLNGGSLKVSKGFEKLRDREVVLFLSRINFKKGMDILVRAFGIVARARPNAHLVIAGPDNEGYARKVKKWLDEERILHRVTFAGMLSGCDKIAAFQSAHVFVLPSYTENFGIAIVEAMSFGLPIVISNKVNIWREIADAGAGIVVNCDAQETANAINTILESPEAARMMGRRGAELVKSRFTWTSVARSMNALYERIGVRKS